jgi:hypothetical protein
MGKSKERLALDSTITFIASKTLNEETFSDLYHYYLPEIKSSNKEICKHVCAACKKIIKDSKFTAKQKYFCLHLVKEYVLTYSKQFITFLNDNLLKR